MAVNRGQMLDAVEEFGALDLPGPGSPAKDGLAVRENAAVGHYPGAGVAGDVTIAVDLEEFGPHGGPLLPQTPRKVLENRWSHPAEGLESAHAEK